MLPMLLSSHMSEIIFVREDGKQRIRKCTINESEETPTVTRNRNKPYTLESFEISDLKRISAKLFESK
jgi:hypothetical protein